jgi:hypothetical protein
LLTLFESGAAVLGAPTRTALIAMAIGLAIAGARMFLGRAGARRTPALLGVIAIVPATSFAPLIVEWLWRGQSLEEVSDASPYLLELVVAASPLAAPADQGRR